jgi:hypothetical protein
MEHLNEVNCGFDGCVCGQKLWHWTLSQENFDCVANPGCGCFVGLCLKTLVVLPGWSYVPASNSMGGPCAPVGSLFVNDNLGTRGCNWGPIVVVHFVEFCVSQHSRVEPGLFEDIERRDSLWNEMIQ